MRIMNLAILCLLFFYLNTLNAGKSGTVTSFDGVKICYEISGEGDVPIIFIHGWSCDRSFWAKQIEYFSKNHKVISLDIAGHGDSGSSRKIYTTESFARDVAALIENLELEKVILVGHSMGGPIAARTAALIPDKVLLVIGADTFQNIEMKFPAETRQQFLAGFKADFKMMTQAFIAQMFLPSTDSVLVKMIVNKMTNANPEIAVSAMENYLEQDPNEFIGSIKCNIVAINSQLNPTAVEINRKYFPDFEVKIMEGVGHFLMLEDPDTFNKLLEEYLSEF